MPDYFDVVWNFVTTLGPLFVFAAVFVECIPFGGVFVPGLTILVLGGAIAGTLSYTQALLYFGAALAGVYLADWAAYLAGRYFADRSKYLAAFRKENEELLARVERSTWALLFYQFPPYSRMFVPLLLGAAKYPLMRWTWVVSVATPLFVTCLFGAGYLAGRIGSSVAGTVDTMKTLSLIAGIGFGVWMAWLFWKQGYFRRKG